MPFVRVEMRQGKSREFKRALLDQIHEALVEALKIPADDRTQRLYELAPDQFEFPEHRRDDLVLIEITMFKGRSAEAKKMLFRRIAERLAEKPGIDSRNVAVVLHEPPLENWGFGGVAASEMDLGFKVEV